MFTLIQPSEISSFERLLLSFCSANMLTWTPPLCVAPEHTCLVPISEIKAGGVLLVRSKPGGVLLVRSKLGGLPLTA